MKRREIGAVQFSFDSRAKSRDGLAFGVWRSKAENRAARNPHHRQVRFFCLELCLLLLAAMVSIYLKFSYEPSLY